MANDVVFTPISLTEEQYLPKSLSKKQFSFEYIRTGLDFAIRNGTANVYTIPKDKKLLLFTLNCSYYNTGGGVSEVKVLINSPSLGEIARVYSNRLFDNTQTSETISFDKPILIYSGESIYTSSVLNTTSSINIFGVLINNSDDETIYF